MGDDSFVDVLYALPDEQTIVRLPFTGGMTARDAVERSGLAERFPEIAARPLVIGVYGVKVEPGHRLQAGDRVEICRPLVADPRDMRRELIAGGRVMGGAQTHAPASKKPATKKKDRD